MSISNYAELAFLNTLSGTSFSVANTYIKLHTGDPGETGGSNAATETTRQAASWSAASSGSKAISSPVTWTDVSTTEVYTHWSLWDSSSAGSCLWSGGLSTSASVTAGDTFQISSLTLTLD